LTKRLQKLWIVKRSRLPTADQNVARVFKNPIGYRAADLIEEAGLKGARIGEAEVSDRHANFIVANPGASSADVLRLIDLIRDRVAQRLSVELELEIQVW
jgi:UDP-N-acetylmuramate dehydrogenase